MRLSDYLQLARTELAAGWTKGMLCDADGAVCALGAMKLASGGQREPQVSYVSGEVRLDAFRLLCDCAPGGSVIRYNNAPDTTHADVLAWFDAAIAIAEAQERDAERHPALTMTSDAVRGTEAVGVGCLSTRA